MRIHRDERGQTILLVAFSLPILIGFIGIATDVGALFKDKRTMQTAADAAAIAGALDLNSAGSGSLVNLGNVVLAARAASAANGFTDSLNGVHVTVNDPPTWPASNYVGPVGTPNGYVEVTITKTEPTIFLALFGYPSVTVLARAVATNTGPGVCVFAGIGNNPPTGTPLTVAGGTIQATQCGVVVNSNNSPPMAVSGSLTATSVGVVGDCSSGCGGIDQSHNLSQASCPTPTLWPLSRKPPAVEGPTSTSPAAQTPPGCYNGLSAPGNYTINLQGGTYIFAGDLNLSGTGTITGAGVTIFMGAAGALTIGPNTIMTLSAPASGTYNGILFCAEQHEPQPRKHRHRPNLKLAGHPVLPRRVSHRHGHQPDPDALYRLHRKLTYLQRFRPSHLQGLRYCPRRHLAHSLCRPRGVIQWSNP